MGAEGALLGDAQVFVEEDDALVSETEKMVSTCVIVMDVGTGANRTVIGALADAVKDVFEFEQGQIEPPPRFGEQRRMDFIQAIGKRNGQFIIILNFNKAFSTEEVVMLGVTGEGAALTEEEIMESDKADE